MISFLSYIALSYESTVINPIYCDLYLTLGSPLGTYYAHDSLWWEEIAVNGYVNEQLVALNFASCDNCYPRTKRCVNYWAWGDVISGPLGDFMSGEENIQVDTPSEYTHDTRNASTTPTWHYYDSLQPGRLPENLPLKDMVEDLLNETITN